MSDNIQEAEVGSGTKVADTKQSEKRAQLTLKSIQLRLKQEKERAALQQQKKSLQVKEDIGESFSPSQIAALKAEYSKINTIDPSSDTYKKLIAMLDRLDLKSLQSLAGAEIKFVSKLAQNRVMRKSMKKEEVQLDELSTNKLADYKKKAGESATAADKAGDTKTGNKRFSGIMKATRKQFDNDAKKTNEELDIELAEVLAKDATAGDFIHDFVNSDNPMFAGKSKEKRKQMALAAYYAKKKNEELSPKQKALDKNKNGKIDGSDLAKLRGESASNLKPGWMLKRDPELAKKVKEKQDLAKKRQATYGDKSAGKSMNEKTDYEVYHKDYSTAVQTAIKQAEKRGYEVDMDDWHDKVATGPKKPSSGKTNSFSINLMKDGKPSKKKLQMQVYNMDNHRYELNMYIEEIQLDELNKDTLHSYAKKSEKDQDDQYNKIGKGIRDNDAKSANKAGHKFSMRSIGQNRAEKRLNKEGVAEDDRMKKALERAKTATPKKPADEYDRKVVKYLKKKHGMVESIMDKIKAMKRGAEAKAKADDHWDKAGDPKNPEAKKDLKKAVRYTNLLNKEEVVLEAKKSKTFKNIKKKMKEEETPNKSTVKKGDALTGKREPIEINPELKEPGR
jgi:hypothetical protein